MVTFGAKVLDTINRSKSHYCERRFSPMMLKGKQMVYSVNKEITNVLIILIIFLSLAYGSAKRW